MVDFVTAKTLANIRGGRVLTDAEQEQALKLLGRWLGYREVCAKLKISEASFTVTRKQLPDFDEAVKHVMASRIMEVENEAYKLATGGSRQVTETFTACLDRHGVPEKDEDGKQRMILMKREVKTLPPTPAIIEFLLRKHMPELYGDKAAQHEARPEMLEMMRVMLEGKIKDAEKFAIEAVTVQSNPKELQ